ncbi:MAG TPA: ABC transporter permease [Thermoanaerobaculia bacterium]|nr:ABC transporter permease [Thermoanaerobaculia bacterium]
MNTQPLYWSIRREVWENRGIYIAPATVAAVALFAFLVGAMAKTPQLHKQSLSEQPYNFVALLIMGTTFLVSIFYCLDAIHGERRDRSVLFWKSLPVSDTTAVLSKMAVPLVVLPLLTFAITFAAQLLMLMMQSASLMLTGRSPATLWASVPVIDMWPMLLYHLVTVHALYYAPIFAWLLFVSAWARRLPFLWAFLPLAAIGIVERMVFGTTHFAHMLGSRISGGMEGGSTPMPGHSLWGHFMPGEFLLSPGLWLGFVVAALFLAGTVRLRRVRGPS